MKCEELYESPAPPPPTALTRCTLQVPALLLQFPILGILVSGATVVITGFQEILSDSSALNQTRASS